MLKFHWSFEYRDGRLEQVNSIVVDESLDEVFWFFNVRDNYRNKMRQLPVGHKLSRKLPYE